MLVALFAALYYTFGQAGASHIGWREAAVLSITAFHGRVFASPFTPNNPQSVVTAVEAITGFLFPDEGTASVATLQQAGEAGRATTSNKQHVVSVSSKILVVRKQGQRLEQRLRHQGSIEWIAMVMRKSRYCGSMFQSEW